MNNNGKKESYSTPILYPIHPDEFWARIREIVREEIKNIKVAIPAANSSALLETPGLTYKPLLKMTEVCELFQVTKPTIYDRIKQGILKSLKIKSIVYFLRQDIDALMQIK